MCDKCGWFERHIAQCKRLIDPAADPLTIAAMRMALEQLEGERSEYQCPNIIKGELLP